MTIDVDRVRRDTPTCLGQHFLDNAGSALPVTTVVDAVVAHLRREAEVGGYVAQREAEGPLLNTVAALGELVGVRPDQVAVTTSASAAFVRGFTAIPLGEGDRVLATAAEYANNLLPMLAMAKHRGVVVELIPDGPDGAVDPAALGAMLDDRVKIVAITHAPSQNGLLVDGAAIGQVLRAADSDAWYLLDACQSVGQLPINMASIGADMIAATGRKFLRAPRGIGFLALSDRALASLEPSPPDMFGTRFSDAAGSGGYRSNPDASRFRSFEISYAGLLGAGVAARYALDLGLPDIRSRINQLATTLRLLLADVPGVRVVDQGTERTGIVVFTCPGDDPMARVGQLADQGITVVAVTPPVNPGHVASYESNVVLRASVHVYNTELDLTRLVETLG